jgi:hypothetical protein
VRRGRLPRRSRRARLRPSAAVVGGFAAGETRADAPAGRGTGEMGMRRKGGNKKNGGSHVWRGNGGPPGMEGGRGNLEGYAKWRLV